MALQKPYVFSLHLPLRRSDMGHWIKEIIFATACYGIGYGIVGNSGWRAFCIGLGISVALSFAIAEIKRGK